MERTIIGWKISLEEGGLVPEYQETTIIKDSRISLEEGEVVPGYQIKVPNCYFE